ncbi:MAG: hypothetical protein GF350_07530 [Chitinivibrionales bacterium]|nr:hypothetical protein [Chitinivibrionales bacterium]
MHVQLQYWHVIRNILVEKKEFSMQKNRKPLHGYSRRGRQFRKAATIIATAWISAWIALILLFISGCAGTSEETSKETVDRIPGKPSFKEVLHNTQEFIGTHVKWGGTIIKITRTMGCTQILVRQVPRAKIGMPVEDKYSQGRFIGICTEKLDRDRVGHGETITLAGMVHGTITRPLGKDDLYTHPVLLIDTINVCGNTNTYGLESETEKSCEEVYTRELSMIKTLEKQCLEIFK